MLLSIIIPVYNVEKYLRRCLDSIINKRTDEVEIILVDDGSSDNSSVICDEYANTYGNIKVIHQRNGGLSVARNTGIDNAKGKYLAFLDSDDFFDDSFIDDILRLIEGYNVDIFSFNCSKMYKSGVYKSSGTKDLKIYSKLEYLEKIIDNTYSCQICFRVFRKSLFDSICFPVGCYYEDMRTLWRLVCFSQVILHIDYTYYIYNLSNSGAITKLTNLKSMSDMKESVDIMAQGVLEEFAKCCLLNDKILEYVKYFKTNVYCYIMYKLRYLKNDETGIWDEISSFLRTRKINLFKFKRYDWKKYLFCILLIKFRNNDRSATSERGH